MEISLLSGDRSFRVQALLVETTGTVARFDFYTDFLKERGRQYPPGTNNNRIVGQIDLRTLLV